LKEEMMAVTTGSPEIIAVITETKEAAEEDNIDLI